MKRARMSLVKLIGTGLALITLTSATLAQAPAAAPVLAPEALKQPLAGDWTSYSGDYTGQRYSRLTQVTPANVKNLTLAWATRISTDLRGDVATGGEGKGDFPVGQAAMRGTVLEVNGILYATSPDHVWAIDGRDGRELWHFFWKSRGSLHIGNRGAAIWNNSLLFETPDNYLVSIDVRTGKENWHVAIADLDQQYFSTMAPIVVGDQVLVGTGNDLDAPGFLQSFDARTGKRNWIHYTVPMNPGDPGLDTWPSLDAARHGNGGQVWVPGRVRPRDQSLHLQHRQPHAGLHGHRRARATTCSPAH
jgi:alcohol dehydrogenase (cytochrome c)